MGVCYSCNSSSSSILKNVRVVHLNGFVEDFEQSILASQVIGNATRHFVCTSIQLLSSPSNPLKGDTQLQVGQVYFMLPYSILQHDFSPVDLACIAKKLTETAKTRPSCGFSCSTVGVAEQIGRSPCRVQPWRPVLDTITEKPINSRTKSDLQDKLCLIHGNN